MKSFRHEHEDLLNPIVEQDILELAQKIDLFKNGKINEEKFKSLRLARGVYGQRQVGVQMIRIKIPYGKLTTNQLRRIAQVSDDYSNGNLHCTTRQDIQLHHVSLDRTPQLWADLEKDDVTLREACGNTVRNITASYLAGIDPKEPFDVSPYADALFRYLLRNPIGQDLGRKFKIAFSSSDEDTALTFIHDLGFIPKLKNEQRGFKVVLGGGLGAQPFLAQTAFEFLEEDEVIPFTDALIRVFDRYGERARRHKARIKYLVDELGIEKILELVEKERIASPFAKFSIPNEEQQKIKKYSKAPQTSTLNIDQYDLWLKTNVIEQKQKGYYAILLKLQTGDISSETARALANLVDQYAADDIRVTTDQNLLLKFILPENLPYLFQELSILQLTSPGAGSIADITTCPGTDTCNLGITSSYGAARALEEFIQSNYTQFLTQENIRIRISGCMNSCGQHGIAQIGFHGSTIKVGERLMPALQILLGGGINNNGIGQIADKVIKVPAKRAKEALELILNDFIANGDERDFNSYYQLKGKIYFYDLLKSLNDKDRYVDDDYIDWGHDENYLQAIGIGECAGVAIDLIATLLYETEEKLDQAERAFENQRFSDSIYFSYSTFVTGAKTALIQAGEKTNSQAGIISDYESKIQATIDGEPFSKKVYQIHTFPASEKFAKRYLTEAKQFYNQLTETHLKKKNHELIN